MPGIVRKLLIFAAVDGLVLQPLAHRGQRPAPAAKVAYNDNNIGPVGKTDGDEDSRSEGQGFEAFGVVGLLNVSNSSYLISIVRRQQVATIQGKPIYVITEVALIPLASRTAASVAIEHTRVALRKGTGEGHELDDSDTDEERGNSTGSDDVDDHELQPAVMSPTMVGPKQTTSVAEDVISKRGNFGRFAKEWFSNRGWTADQRRNLGMTTSGADPTKPQAIYEEENPPKDPLDDIEADKANVLNNKGKNADELTGALLPKLLRTTQLYFGTSRSFYFSYDYDLTRSFLDHGSSTSELPLYQKADPLYFWNRFVTQPFIDAGQTSLVLPLLQGFVGQRTFEMDTDPPSAILALGGAAEKSSMEMVDMSPRMSQDGEFMTGVDGPPGLSRGRSKSPRRRKTMKSFSLTLISRRSVKRAGLRYLRRGVDDDGHTANSVETEQILSDAEWRPSSKIHSFVQLRGSIPIFFSQSPYSFKPVPQIQHSTETNYQAFAKHFANISKKYGRIQAASLVEKHGPEAIVGEQFDSFAKRLNAVGGIRGLPVGFEWFDFHAACKGMKFENVSRLMDTLGDTLDEFGYTVEVDGIQKIKQGGVLRTNCMDCLDRTNVVQNYIGQRALELQLKDEGIDLSLQPEQNIRWFNILWADNGDAVSKQYASTAAMKGDFTRTRTRDYKGALTDMGLSISRFYSGIVNDFFSQAAIDFLLGNVSAVVFEDFETSLMSRDPAVSIQKMRQQAIDACQEQLVADDREEIIGGWTLLTPQVPNTIKSTPFEESILILTDSALYSCRFDWNMEKASSFERVSLAHILSIKRGTYITSTLSSSQANEQRNVGFVVTYQAGKNDIARVNTRSMANVSRLDLSILGGASTSPQAGGLASLIGRPTSPANRVLALKALSTRSAEEYTDNQLSEIDQVKDICEEIQRMILLREVVEVGAARKVVVEEGAIISLNEARKSTGLLEQLGHSFKKLIWA